MNVYTETWSADYDHNARCEPVPHRTIAGGEIAAPERVPSRSILMEAEGIVNGARRSAYGHPENNFARIANLWNAYLRGRLDPQGPISPQDVALLMCLMKVARLLESPTHRDSLVDLAGYAATVEMLWETT